MMHPSHSIWCILRKSFIFQNEIYISIQSYPVPLDELALGDTTVLLGLFIDTKGVILKEENNLAPSNTVVLLDKKERGEGKEREREILPSI